MARKKFFLFFGPLLKNFAHHWPKERPKHVVVTTICYVNKTPLQQNNSKLRLTLLYLCLYPLALAESSMQ